MTLTAPGGWALPTEYIYEFSDVPFPDPLVLPYFTITRGGIRYPLGPVRHYRWHARSPWGRRIKRVLFGVQWIDV
ncbi:virion structural protein [Mycobacterium phage Adawi]|uniref:Structural protein n=1 Tax=Mycobacterium phage Adawi TaxID=1354507 RepID=T2A990_9CAUD|nr:virion structural protein [Mycobacterium phage Adawi]AGU91979.1 structural protein [Mycobacterium phage Adawi]